MISNSNCAQGHGVDGLHVDGTAFERVLDLTPYVNTSAPAVAECFSLERAYMMFRQLGLRHLVIVDQHNHVKGILSRKVRPSCCSMSKMQARMSTKVCICMAMAEAAIRINL